MYRDADPERKLRAGARRDELSERAKALLDEQRYGRVARAALIDALERLDVEDLATLEGALDALEEAIAAFTAAAASESERADPFRLLGPPSADAEVFTESFSRFMFAGAPSASQRRAIVACLQAGAARWTKQMGSAPLVDAHPDRLALYFEHEGGPLRLDIGIGELDDGDLYEKATLSGVVALGDGVRISVRPQTMGDDILASLRIRRDLTFGEDMFDATYFLSGEESDLRALLTPEVRAAFVRVARESPATVDVANGIATMRLYGTQSLAGAATLLAGFARARPA